MTDIDHFIPGQAAEYESPLERYLEPLPENVVASYVAACTRAGDLVLDPLAQRTTALLAAAAQGRRGIASNFSPLSALLIEGLLTLPAPQDIDAATMQLGDSPKRGIPLREHINQLYASTCHHCFQPVIVDYFVWDGENDRPVQKHYDCPHCAVEGQFPVQESDLETLKRIEKQGVHYWYVLERLARPHQPERKLAQELLELYTPRNLYALTDLSMKIEALFSNSPLQLGLQLILLSCLDTCSKLGGPAMPRPTALRLHPRSRFLERNVWHAFEQAYRQVRELSPPPDVNLSQGLEELVSDERGQAIVINEPLRRLSSMLPPASVSLVISAPRAYYRPFWTLSYLWSGWLWGREKATLFRHLIRRKAMGWSWYRRSLSASLRTLHHPLRRQGKMVFILESVDLAHVTNMILAAVGATFKLERILYQPHDSHLPKDRMGGVDGAYRLTFSRDERSDQRAQPPLADRLATSLQQAALRAASELLRERGEALHFGWLHTAIHERWGRDDLLRQIVMLEKEVRPTDFLEAQIEAALEEGLKNATLELLPRDETEEEPPCLWWLHGQCYPPRPLGDRVEQAVCEALRGGPDLDFEALRDSIYARFPGFFTPRPGLLEECLSSYGLRDDVSGRWRLRPEDERNRLAQEKGEAVTALAELGQRFGYQVSVRGKRLSKLLSEVGDDSRPPPPRGMDVAWDEEGVTCHLFAFRQMTILADILREEALASSEVQRYIVIPDRRVDLVRSRMENEVLLSRALTEQVWQFIKLGHLRTLAGGEEVERRDLARIVGLEPSIESPEAQLPLFS